MEEERKPPKKEERKPQKEQEERKPKFEEFRRETKGKPGSFGPFSEDTYYSMSDESETIQGKDKKKSKVEKKSESHVQVMSDKKSEYYSYSSGDNAEKVQKESPKPKKKKFAKFEESEPVKKHERKIEIVMQPSDIEMKTKIHIPTVDKSVKIEEKLSFKSFKPIQETDWKQKEPPKPPKIIKDESKKIDIDTKIPPFWKKRDSDTDEPSYSKEHSPKFERKIYRETRPPTPPSRYEPYPKFDDSPKPVIEFPDSEPEALQERREIPKIYPKKEPFVKSQPPYIHTEDKRSPSPILFQEPPPEEGFIPPPKSFSNAVGVESTKITKIEDSSQFHKRFVQMEQTTRMIKLSGPSDLSEPSYKTKVDKKIPRSKPDDFPKYKLKETTLQEIPIFEKNPLPKLEPFPFTVGPATSKPKKEKGPPPPIPKKFFKGEMRESDYESDSDIHIKPKWHPPDSDADDLTYGKVDVPKDVVKKHKKTKERTPTPPSIFDDKPPPTGEPMRPKVETVEFIKLREPSPEFIIPTEITLMEEKELAKILATRQPSPPVYRRQYSPPIPLPGSPPIEGFIVPKTKDVTEIKYESVETKTSPKPKKKEYREIIERTERKISDKQYKEERTFRTGKIEIIKTTVTERRPEERSQDYESELKLEHQDTIIQSVPSEFETPSIISVPKGFEDVSDLEPFPFKVEESRPKREKGPAPPQPRKFVKGELSESGVDSDFEEKIPALWKPQDSDVDEPSYSKIEVSFPKGRRPSKPDERLPTPPTVFDRGPAKSELLKLHTEKGRSELKPEIVQHIQKHDLKTEMQISMPVKPAQRSLDKEKVTAVHEIIPKEKLYIRHEQPVIESKERISVKGIPSQKRYDIDIDIVDVYDYASETESEKVYSDIGVYKTFPDLEPFPYAPEPQRPKRERGQAPPTPKKFMKGEMRGSDYESEYESKIPPKWAPTDSEGEGLSYRKVKPPEGSTLVVTKSKENGRVPSPPSKFDHPPSFEGPPRPVIDVHDLPRRERRESLEEYSIPKFPKVEFKPFDLEDDIGKKSAFVQTTDTETDTEGLKESFLRSPINKKYTESTQKYVGEQFSDMNQTFRTKAQKFAEQLVSEVFAEKDVGSSLPTESEAPKEAKLHPIERIKKKEENGLDVRQPQAYRDESRISEFGSKHIDPDSGLIYFKYDFGYEFGIVLPGEAKKVIRSKSVPPGSQNGDIEIPVIHERSDDESVTNKRVKFEPQKGDKAYKQHIGKSVPGQVPKYAQSKPVFGDPFSDSEAEARLKKGFPYSFSKKPPKIKPFGPPLPGISIRPKQQYTTQDRGPDYKLSSPSLVSSISSAAGPKPPTFVEHMKERMSADGDEMRLECLVQGSVPSKVSWYKNGFLLKESYRCQPHYDNGICMLIFLHPHSDDSGHYTCSVENALGRDSTSTAVVISPGETS